jgi:Icc-related predicted phosphoesterase
VSETLLHGVIHRFSGGCDRALTPAGEWLTVREIWQRSLPCPRWLPWQHGGMPPDPTVVLFCGDVHGDAGEVDYCLAIARAQHAQATFFVGDFGYWEHEPSGVAYLDQVEKAATSHDVPVYFLDGNHDKISLLLDIYQDRDDEGFVIVRPHVRYAPRGHRWTWSGVRFLSFGGAYSTDKEPRLAMEQRRARYQNLPPHGLAGTLWFPEEEATEADLAAALAGPPVDVLLAHDKPRNTTPAINRKDEWDAYPNQERIQRLVDDLRPTLLVHGHLHYRYSEQLGPTRVEGLACDPRAAWGIPGYAHEDLYLPVDLTDLVSWTVGSRSG